ncbi:MAG TPA: hypothetical protein VFV50_10415 [Bdellovibrionales bacterium]|nr:hypothetical protein [Bdellovibrionales bacterium]
MRFALALAAGLSLCACSPQSFDFKAIETVNGISTPSITINGGAEFTNNLEVRVTVQSPDTKWMKLTNDKDCATAADWMAQADQTAWTLAAENSMNEVYAKFRSRNGFETECVQASIVHDNRNPLAQIVERPPALNPVNVARFKFQGHDDGSGLDYFECQLRFGSFFPCAPEVAYSSLAEGNHNLLVRAVDRAGNRSEPVSAQWFIDTIPPDATIVSGPPRLSNQSAATLQFTADDRGGSGIAKVSCTLGPLLLDTCTSPFFVPNLVEGQYLLSVWATDRVGHVSAVATYGWTIDNIPTGEFSIIGVDAPPADQRVDSWLGGVSPTVHWTASNGATQYRASILTESGAVACSEATTTAAFHAFGAGCVLNDLTRYRARVVASDGAGNLRAVESVFTADRTAPQITISQPQLSTDQKTARVDFSVDDLSPGQLGTVTCFKTHFESGQPRVSQQSCLGVTSLTFSNLITGEHKFRVVATDLAGNTAEREITWRTQQVICDPFSGDLTACRGGLTGEIYYLNQQKQEQFRALATKSVDFYFSDGTKLNAVVNLLNLFGSTRRFNLGFPTADGNLVKDDQGNTLVEYFAFKLRSLVKLHTGDEPGYYQFAILSDDGSRLHAQRTPGGGFELLVDNDGNHSTRMGCSSSLVQMTSETRLPIELDYYQGPRDYIALTFMWRKVTPPGSADPLCGAGSNDFFFGPYPHNDYSNAYGYGQLVERGWKVLNENNFIAPQ